MKKIVFLSLISVSLGTFSCKKYNDFKEKRVAKKLEGKWELEEFKTKENGKDTSYKFDKFTMQYIFNSCPNPDSLRTCSGSIYQVFDKDTLYQNLYTPFAIRYIDSEKIKITVNKVTKSYEILEYKKDKLSLKEINPSDNSEIGSLKAKRMED